MLVSVPLAWALHAAGWLPLPALLPLALAVCVALVFSGLVTTTELLAGVGALGQRGVTPRQGDGIWSRSGGTPVGVVDAAYPRAFGDPVESHRVASSRVRSSTMLVFAPSTPPSSSASAG